MRRRIGFKAWCCAAVISIAAILTSCHEPRPATITLSAAASLQDALVEVEADYNRERPRMDFRNNFGSSGTLAREIEQGAPVDAFVSADSKSMDELAAKGLIVPGTRHNLLRNTLVLIAPRDSALQGFEGLADKSVRLIALGDPASVPAGQYAKQTLTAMNLYDKLEPRFVLGKDVRQVLTYVETGNADAGLVYATDSQSSNRVRLVAVAAASTHDPIVYPAAAIASGKTAEAARGFIQYLGSPAAQGIFVKHGFTIASP